MTCFFSAGDATVRLWPFTNAEDIKEITPLVLAQEEKDNVNVGHAPGKDVTALDWNVSLFPNNKLRNKPTMVSLTAIFFPLEISN